jgi:hypothetical protein
MVRRALVLRLLEFLHDVGYSLEGSPPDELRRHLGDGGVAEVRCASVRVVVRVRVTPQGGEGYKILRGIRYSLLVSLP